MNPTSDNLFGIHTSALNIWQRRSEVLANNLANADTPGYLARDIDFRKALAAASGGSGDLALQCIADRRIEAALPFACDDRVPYTYAVRPQAHQPLSIRDVDKRLAKDLSEHRPEMVARMRVILLRGQRRHAGKAAEYQHAGVARDDRRQSLQKRWQRGRR